MKIFVAGSVCHKLTFKKTEFVEFVGYIDSVDDFYDSIDVAIVPIEFSSGIKIKAIEALSQSKPLIAHSHAMEGIPSTHPFHQCHSFRELAVAMCEIAYEPEKIWPLQKSSEKSYAELASTIDFAMNNITQKVSSSFDIVVVLPHEYGNEGKMLHWFSKAVVDPIRKTMKSLLVLLDEDTGMAQDKFVRIMQADQLSAFLSANPNIPVLHLKKDFDPTFQYGNRWVYSYVNIPPEIAPKHIHISFLNNNAGLCLLPDPEYMKIPKVKDKANKQRGIITVGAKRDKIPSYMDAFIELLKQDDFEKVCYCKFEEFDELDKFVTTLEKLPRKILIASPLKDISASEACLIHIFQVLRVPVISLENYLDYNFLMNQSLLEENQITYCGHFTYFLQQFENKIIQQDPLWVD